MDKAHKDFAKQMMGKPTVVVSAVYKKVKDHEAGTGCYEALCISPRAAWLVGYKRKMIRWTVNSEPLYEDDGQGDGGRIYGTQKSAIESKYKDVYLVLFSPTHNPVSVPCDAVKLNDAGMKASAFSPELLRSQREGFVKHPDWYKRDRLGRFV